MTVHRTYANAASIEFDALVFVGELPPAPDAMVSGDAKAGTPAPVIDPRVVKLAGKAWRHVKALSIVGADGTTLAHGGVNTDSGGVLVGDADQVAPQLLELLAQHRSWGRFATSADV